MKTFALIDGGKVTSIFRAAQALDEAMIACPANTRAGWAFENGRFTPATDADKKMHGVQIDGVMCSATSADQNGLIAVLMAYQLSGQDFKPTIFEFENGNSLQITSSNIQNVIDTWMPFRQQFFSV